MTDADDAGSTGLALKELATACASTAPDIGAKGPRLRQQATDAHDARGTGHM